MTVLSNRIRLLSFLSLLLVLVMPFAAQAQSISLTPEQQRMLNQLPPTQRQAAMQQLRNLQRSAEEKAPGLDEETMPDLQAQPPIDEEEQEPEGPPVFASGDTLVLEVERREPVGENRRGPPDEQEVLDATRERILKRNPYRLDALGRLALPGIDDISLAGLTEEQASLRVAAEPPLSEFRIFVTRLPLEPVGVDALEPFGYGLFERDPARLQRSQAVPVASDYILGPGDALRILLFGNQSGEFELPVDRDGVVRLPDIGPASVAGLTYEAAQRLIADRVSEKMIGTRASVTLGELRSVPVFVVGDVREPGAYEVSPMSTITTALAISGGVAEQGTLRRIQLKRGGTLVQTLDVYDVILRGDTNGDLRLQAGDVVFVPPVGTRVTVAGEVKRPAIYEYRGAENVADIIDLAGGLRPTAYRAGVKVERLVPGGGLQVFEADQTAETGRGEKVADGDTILVPKNTEQLERSVRLAGNVQRPGSYQWYEGLRISDLLDSSRRLKEGSDLNYILIRREPVPNAELQVVSVDLEAAWRERGGSADTRLEPRDTVFVFDLEVGREHIVSPLIDELRLRSSRERPLPSVRIGGRVNAEGGYPLELGMRVSDLVRAGGGLAESAFLGQAELTRYEIVDGEARRTALIDVDLRAALAGEADADIPLRSFDYLNIKEIPRWRDQEFVEILGELAFPGRYPIRQGETLSSVLERAGGLTELAFPAGSVFTRESLKEREREQLETLARRLEGDLAAMSLSDPGQSEALGIGQSLLDQLRNAEPVGRLVIDLDAVVAETGYDIVLRDGDRLMIPVEAQEVTVLGEVQYTTSHLHDPSLGRDDYIEKSGGTTRRADEKRTYVVRANGEVVVRGGSRFFARSQGVYINAGDTIVVPLHADKVKPLTLWSQATQIAYNLAIAAAAVNSF